MGDLFNSKPGFVAVIAGPAVIPGRVKLSGFDTKTALISGIRVDQKTNQQFQLSLDRSVWLYVFGDQVGNVEVEGLAFPGMCETFKKDGTVNTERTAGGVDDILEFYRQNRVSSSPKPISILLGSNAISSYLIGLRTNAVSLDENPGGLFYRYTFLLSSVPRGALLV